MDLSDKLVIETARQPRLNGEQLPMQLVRFGSDGGSDDGDDGDSDAKIHIVVDSLLPLVKDLVQFGKLCDRLHAAAAQRPTDDEEDDSVVQMIQDLTFEVFAALMRLAVSVQTWRTSKELNDSPDHDTLPLEQTVHLLRTVRLPRLARLAASATEQLQQQLPHLSNGDRGNGDKNDASVGLEPATSDDKEGDSRRPPLQTQEAAAEIAAAVAERLVREHLSVLSSQGTGTAAAVALGELPRLVREEVAPVLDEFQKKMCQQIGDLVRDAVRHETARGGGGRGDVTDPPTREAVV
jgi:hypothetical protein